jgi:hypothetical protein
MSEEKRPKFWEDCPMSYNYDFWKYLVKPHLSMVCKARVAQLSTFHNELYAFSDMAVDLYFTYGKKVDGLISNLENHSIYTRPLKSPKSGAKGIFLAWVKSSLDGILAIQYHITHSRISDTPALLRLDINTTFTGLGIRQIETWSVRLTYNKYNIDAVCKIPLFYLIKQDDTKVVNDIIDMFALTEEECAANEGRATWNKPDKGNWYYITVSNKAYLVGTEC